MKIFVDADACPKAAKEILFRAANREEIPLLVVANTPIRTPESPHISSMVVEKGFDVADAAIVDEVSENDLVITADIPLAALVVEKGARALDPRGVIYDSETVHAKLATRNLLSALRDEGQAMGEPMRGGPPPFGPKDKNKFASTLNQILQAFKAGKRAP